MTKDGASQVWDDYNIVAENADATNMTVNVWGLDIDGTMQGAGGVGGLLAVAREEHGHPRVEYRRVPMERVKKAAPLLERLSAMEKLNASERRSCLASFLDELKGLLSE